MPRRSMWGLLVAVAAVLLTGCETFGSTKQVGSNMGIHYLEIVCSDVDAQIASLERVRGLSFGPPVPDLGNAKVAEAPDGLRIAVRAPLAEHESPIVRTYLEVEDIAAAVKEAEAAGAIIAYPPTQQGDTGTWAIYILADVQMGLWQR